MHTTAGMIAGAASAGLVGEAGGSAWIDDVVAIADDHVGEAVTETVCVAVSGAESPPPQPTTVDTADIAINASMRI